VQWCFAAFATVERLLFEIQMIDGDMGGKWASAAKAGCA